jgi:hypothetical protein
MAKNDIMSLDEMENLFSNTLPIEQLIFLELRDCDVTAGTPLYSQKVNVLRRTIESHHKIEEDKEYKKDIEKATEIIEDPRIILHNLRCSPWNKKEVRSKEIMNYEEIDRACRNFLARRNITFKEERSTVL